MRIPRWLQILAAALVLLGAVAVKVAEPEVFLRLQDLVFDTYQDMRPRPYVTPVVDPQDLARPSGVRIVDVDEESLRRIGQWPWPRTYIAQLVDLLDYYGARAIAFDAVFAEPDRTSPLQAAASWVQDPVLDQIRPLLEQLPDHDQVLGHVITGKPVVAGIFAMPDDSGGLPQIKWGLAFGGATVDSAPALHLPRFGSAAVNLAPIEAAAAGNGLFNVVPSTDGIVRQVPMFFALDAARRDDGLPEPVFPSLSAEAMRVAAGASTYIIKLAGASGEVAFGSETGIARVVIGDTEIAVTADGQVRLYDTGPVPERFIPAWRVFAGEIDPWTIANHIVFIGSSAAGLHDLRATPLQSVTAGAEIHAQIAEQILTGEFLHRPDWVRGAEIAYILVLGVLLVAVQPRLGALAGGLAAAGLVAAALGGSWLAFTRSHLLIEPLVPAATLFVLYSVNTLIGYLRTEGERAQVRGAFSRYLAPELVEELARAPEKLELGGITREMTVMFCDIRGFTSISELLDPHELTGLINRFLSPMTELVMDHRGTIDKYMGDCVMAFWNAPLDDPQHAAHACTASLAMAARLDPLNRELAREAAAAGRPHRPLRIGVGLATGACCVGNMGSDRRFNYSVLGDTVNLASRLEGQTKTYGVDIVVNETTRTQAGAVAALELDLIRVKGKEQPVRIFALLGGPERAGEAAVAALVDRHAAMIAAYRGRDWAAGRALADACRTLAATAGFTLDPLYALYEARLEQLAAHPPGPEWDGVHVAEGK
ncbi:MAG: adenylate/guanylate cyclase domain-containing protein [Rhodospirillaceae bacterium]|nr:adenylate/guanylate cyclase domain-containing protein [Rhodospirillaceae bacterium]